MPTENLAAALVLSDELEERGDPRASLIRAQVHGHDERALLAAHWQTWVGSLEARSVLLRWKWGHLVEVGIGAAPPGWTVDELVRKPTTEFLSRLALGPKVSTRGLEHARALRHLVCFGPFESTSLPTVETLAVDLDGAGVERVPLLAAPKLTALQTRTTVHDEARLLRSLPWFDGLQTWSHRLVALESLTALLANGPLVARGGAGLVLLADAQLLEAIAERAHRTLPHATLRLLPTPRPANDPEDFRGPMQTRVVPSDAPMDFRSRPPSQKVSKRGVQSDEPVVTTIGSGFALSSALFSTCSWCGSANTLGIWSRSSSLYARFECTSYDDWEYDCHDCGLFTGMRESFTH